MRILKTNTFIYERRKGFFNVVLTYYFFSISIINKIKVRVSEGRLTGVIVDGFNVHYIAFRGIPYAKPPVGELRFKVSTESYHE